MPSTRKRGQKFSLQSVKWRDDSFFNISGLRIIREVMNFDYEKPASKLFSVLTLLKGFIFKQLKTLHQLIISFTLLRY